MIANGLTNEQKEKLKIELFLKKFNSPEDLQNWADIFLGIRLPKGHIYPDSNSSPVEWMWEAYNNYKLNKGNETPGYIILSSRESYKTLSESMLAVIFMLHFNATIAHLAAIESQATKALQYINSFIKKCRPYMEAMGMTIDSQSKRRVGFETQDGSISYVNVIIATVAGANSEHTNILCIDEIDVMRFPDAFEEAKFIPGVTNGQYPLTIATSTRKYAFGLMQKEITNAESSGQKVLRWNILDITEKCPDSRHRPNLKKIERYISNRLPLKNISMDEYNNLIENEKNKYTLIKAYNGCQSCPILPICQTRLATRPSTDVGYLYKPIDFVINQFKKTPLEKAEAQLLCLRPGSTGLVYPRFSPEIGQNVISLQMAADLLCINPSKIELDNIVNKLHDLNVDFFAGVDWGFRHAFAITVSCNIYGQWWLIDSYSVPGLELDQMMKLSIEIRDKYSPRKWFADTSQPIFIKEFNKNRMRCAEFKKDVMGGIEYTRGRVMDSFGNRYLKILKHDRNEWLINGFNLHHFKLDSAGKPTQEPDDDEYADIMDTIRYQAQNLFNSKASKNLKADDLEDNRTLEQKRLDEEKRRKEEDEKFINQKSNWIKYEINKAIKNTTEEENNRVKVGKNKNIIWDI